MLGLSVLTAAIPFFIYTQNLNFPSVGAGKNLYIIKSCM